MSYCVNCGVELAESEHNCPLCQTEVMNPNSPWTEPERRPYPKHVELLVSRIDRRYFASLAGLLLLIPALTVLLMDMLVTPGISWSGYVLGGIALVYVSLVWPLTAKKYRWQLFFPLNGLVLALYLLVIMLISGGNWFLSLGLPITVLMTVTSMLMAKFFTIKAWPVLKRVAIGFMLTGLSMILLEAVIRLYLGEVFSLHWSLFVLAPCAVLGFVFLLLNRRKKFQEEIKRRLFF